MQCLGFMRRPLNILVENVERKDTSLHTGVDWRIILKCILKEYILWIWNGSDCLKMGLNGEFLCTLLWAFCFHKMQEVSRKTVRF
jgi:hypothetical protein